MTIIHEWDGSLASTWEQQGQSFRGLTGHLVKSEKLKQDWNFPKKPLHHLEGEPREYTRVELRFSENFNIL